MSNKKEKARETKEHFLPIEYAGRCLGTEKVDYVNGFPTFGRVKELPKGEVLHKFEMRLPIPDSSSCDVLNGDAKEMFNLSGSDLVDKALEKLKTDLDELFKSFLFGFVFREGAESETAIGDLFALPDMPKEPEPEWELIYEGVAHPSDAGESYDPERHIMAQEQVDAWRYSPKQAGKTVSVASFIQQLVNSGRVDADVLEGIETQAELFAKLAELGIL